MDETVGRLEEEVDEGLFTKGAQAAVTLGGETVLHLTLGDDGVGRPMEATTPLRVYCAIKPVTALAVGRLVDDDLVDLDEPLRAHLSGFDCLGEATAARHVLTHTAGVHEPPGLAVEATPPAQRAGFLEGVSVPPGWRIGQQAAYSEYLGWYLLGRLIEHVTATPVGDHLRTELLGPLGLDNTFVGMTAEQYHSVSGRLGVNVDLRAHQPYPMLFERTERVVREANCAHGGYTTAADLCRLYATLLRARSEPVDPHLPEPATVTELTTTARHSFDAVLDRECGYGLGFMTELAGHHYGRDCSPRSFGHSGYVGSSLAFADPT